MKKKKSVKSNEETYVNNNIVNLIAPQGLEFSSNQVEWSGFKGNGYGVLKYPSSLKLGWLSDITNLDSTIVSVSIEPVDEAAFIDALDKNINAKRAETSENTKSSKRQRAIKAIDDAEELQRQIDQDGQSVCEMGLSYVVMSNDDKTLNRLCRRAISKCASSKIKATRLLSKRQDLVFKQCLPTFSTDPFIQQSIKRVAPISTFVGGFPFSSSGFSDVTGNYFARAENNSVIMLDPWVRGGDRTNSNFLITGIQGQGKSTVVKSLAITEYKDGTRIIFIDPEGEYSEMGKELGGDVLYAGGGNARINPFEVQPVPEDDDDDINPIYSALDNDGNRHNMGALASHMKTLEIFLTTYMSSITDLQLSLLKKVILEMYSDFGITWNTDVTMLKHEDFPIFSDLYKKLEEKYKQTHNEDYAIICTRLFDAVQGADQFLWNGYTTINTDNQCVILNTYGLINNSDNVKRAQYFLLLTWCWNQMSKDRQEKVLLFCDEGYTLVDPKVPQSIGFLRNAMKRDRKYESGIVFITHSVVDLLDPSVKMYGQALIDIPCYKIMFGTDGQNLIETKNLYNLTDAEEEFLNSKERGKALCFIGSRRITATFLLPQYRLELMGSSGGR